jgi:hypothetical protein
MMEKRSMSKRIAQLSARSRWGVATLVVALLAAGGIAYAAVPNSATGQITVCYPASGAAAGQLRVIDYQAGTRCRSTEKMLSWQQNGVRYKGVWKSTVAYSPNDLVVAAGSSYVAIAASTNVAPTNTTKWAVFAAKGAPGTPGPRGLPGAPGAPAPRPANVVWVAPSGGDFTTVSSALASITDNGAAHPYVVKVAPGTYNEPGGIDLKDYVDLEGSGQDTTTITCACGSVQSPASADGASATLRATGPNLHSEVRQITVVNTGPNVYSTAIWTYLVPAGALTFTGVTAQASGGTGNYGIWSQDSSPTMRDMVATSTGDNSTSTESFAVTVVGSAYNYHAGLAMDHVVAKASGAMATIGVRLRDNVNQVLTSGVDARAVGFNDPGAFSAGVYLINAHAAMHNAAAVSTRVNAAAASWGADATGTSGLIILDSFLEGFNGAINLDPPAASIISRDTLNGTAGGSGTYVCSFNLSLSGYQLPAC